MVWIRNIILDRTDHADRERGGVIREFNGGWDACVQL